MADIPGALASVGISNWVAIGALVIAAIALWRGERRAAAERRRASDRNLVKWSVTWPNKDGFVLTCLGPDDALEVWVQFHAEGRPGEAAAKSMRRGDELFVPMPHLEATWEVTRWLEAGERRERANVLAYGGEATWRSPAGQLGHVYFDSTIQTWREFNLGIY